MQKLSPKIGDFFFFHLCCTTTNSSHPNKNAGIKKDHQTNASIHSYMVNYYSPQTPADTWINNHGIVETKVNNENIFWRMTHIHALFATLICMKSWKHHPDRNIPTKLRKKQKYWRRLIWIPLSIWISQANGQKKVLMLN